MSKWALGSSALIRNWEFGIGAGAVFGDGCGSDATEVSPGQRRLHDIGSVHAPLGPARGARQESFIVSSRLRVTGTSQSHQIAQLDDSAG